jgi:hypothetical protein
LRDDPPQPTSNDVSFLVSLLLPIIAAALYLRGYLERAALGTVPPRITTAAALTGGALSGAAALVFLGVLGVVILTYRGRTLTPAGLDVPGPLFWITQFLIAAAIGAAVGAAATLALLPWARGRLAHIAPAPPA